MSAGIFVLYHLFETASHFMFKLNNMTLAFKQGAVGSYYTTSLLALELDMKLLSYCLVIRYI